MGRLIFLLLFCLSAHAEEITGNPHIIDGDSIRIGDTEIRLHGIDAPEAKQLCKVKGKEWRCGKLQPKHFRFFS
jgi:endonuclease YncB( thermonuclease family)